MSVGHKSKTWLFAVYSTALLLYLDKLQCCTVKVLWMFADRVGKDSVTGCPPIVCEVNRLAHYGSGDCSSHSIGPE